MNIDFYGLFDFGDEEGVKQFVLAHRFTHEQEAGAIGVQYGANISTYGLSGDDIVEPWIALMRGDTEGIPQPIQDWLQSHNDNHQAMLFYLTGSTTSTLGGTVSSTDLSQVDFGNPSDMETWLTLHQELHDFEQQALGLTG